jgi:hypothetical protein
VKRRIFKLFVFLLLGAIINVAVARRYALHWGFPEKPMTSTGIEARDVAEASLFGVRLTELNLQTGSWNSTTWSVQQEMAAGLPFHSMYASRVDHYGISGPTQVLPKSIIWPGFAINTIFYAAIVWALFFAPGAVRRRVRRKRGQCAACGYSLREKVSRKCPECGKPA